MVRFGVIGAIVAFTVPLFLSLVQSALLKNIVEYPNTGEDYSDLLVLVGFCVVAGFSSHAFMNSLAAKVMQLQGEVQRVDKKAEVARETAVEAFELSEESTDRSIEAISGTIGPRKPDHAEPSSSGDTESALTPGLDGRPVPELSPIEQAVVKATSRLSKRTATGVAKDARIPRAEVGEVVDELTRKGLIRHTISANTGGPRIQLTELGVKALNQIGSYGNKENKQFDPS